MNRKFQVILLTALALMIAIPAAAQEKKKKKKGDRQPQQIAAIMKKIEGAGLSEEQVGKIKEIAKELGPKFQELNNKRRESLGRDVIQKMTEARKAAQAAGKKGKELQEASVAVLSEEQKATMKELQAATAKLTSDLRSKVVAVIGEEKAKELSLQKGGGKGKGKGKAKKKKAA